MAYLFHTPRVLNIMLSRIERLGGLLEATVLEVLVSSKRISDSVPETV